VLLPGSDGKVGAVSVVSDGKEQVLNQPYASAKVGRAGSVEAGTTNRADVQQAFGPALAAMPIRPTSFTVYFEEGTDELTPQSKLVVAQIFSEITRRQAPDVIVIGHTDAVGTPAYNDDLSIKRAERMRNELVKLGAASDRIRIAGRGKREPLIRTPDGVPEPRNRRVEVSVR
jgi:outer membrane protein OmpA-like peptidoglycan-associated protein